MPTLRAASRSFAAPACRSQRCSSRSRRASALPRSSQTLPNFRPHRRANLAARGTQPRCRPGAAPRRRMIRRRVLLDENLPVRLRLWLPGVEATTVELWVGKAHGTETWSDLLKRAVRSPGNGRSSIGAGTAQLGTARMRSCHFERPEATVGSGRSDRGGMPSGPTGPGRDRACLMGPASTRSPRRDRGEEHRPAHRREAYR